MQVTPIYGKLTPVHDLYMVKSCLYMNYVWVHGSWIKIILFSYPSQKFERIMDCKGTDLSNLRMFIMDV